MSHDSSTRRLFPAALVAITLIVAACGGGGGGGSKTGDLVLQVVDARQPSVGLAGATVTVTAGTASKTATTPADGAVTFRDLPAGPATVVVARDLFLDYTSTGTVRGGASVGLTASLQRRSGQVNVKAVDTFVAPVSNVQLQVSIEGQTITAVTGATGEATLTGVPTGAVSVQATASGFLPEPALAVIVVESPAASLEFVMDRQTEPAGGIVTPPPGTPPPPPSTDGGQTLTLRIRTVVLNGQGQAIEDRQAAHFTLVACVDSVPTRAECVRSTSDSAFDAAYAPVSATPDEFAKLPGQAPVPYAAALTYDQSRSTDNSDPSDARIFASKGFLQTLGSSDRVVLAAFASGTGAKIPVKPVTTYGPFTSNGVGYFDELDQFPTLEGGLTPLYQGLNTMLQYTADNAPTGIAGQRKAVVVFSDGFDNVGCNVADCTGQSIALSRDLDVDIFTIGRAASVDTATLAELSHHTNGVHLVAANAEQLNAIYVSLGALLGGSITTYEATWTIRAANTGVFTSGRSVLGTVRVVTADKTLDLPFLYTIP